MAQGAPAVRGPQPPAREQEDDARRGVPIPRWLEWGAAYSWRLLLVVGAVVVVAIMSLAGSPKWNGGSTRRAQHRPSTPQSELAISDTVSVGRTEERKKWKAISSSTNQSMEE